MIAILITLYFLGAVLVAYSCSTLTVSARKPVKPEHLVPIWFTYLILWIIYLSLR